MFHIDLYSTHINNEYIFIYLFFNVKCRNNQYQCFNLKNIFNSREKLYFYFVHLI